MRTPLVSSQGPTTVRALSSASTRSLVHAHAPPMDGQAHQPAHQQEQEQEQERAARSVTPPGAGRSACRLQTGVQGSEQHQLQQRAVSRRLQTHDS
jgi:hypothetical protein